ncbi:hypothetical protein JZU46_06185 [bacterium]|nr:hypothetical protein [bacterium]
MERQLATVQKILKLSPITGADRIECAEILGWECIVPKGEFKEGDLCIYIEIDSWIPHELAPFLSKGKEPKTYNGIKGARLRTVKMKGVVSQGLILSLSVLNNLKIVK